MDLFAGPKSNSFYRGRKFFLMVFWKFQETNFYQSLLKKDLESLFWFIFYFFLILE